MCVNHGFDFRQLNMNKHLPNYALKNEGMMFH